MLLTRNLLKALQCSTTAAHRYILTLNSLDWALSSDFLAFYLMLLIQANALSCKWLSWVFLLWLPLNGPCGQLWCNGCLPVGQTASSERRKDNTNQCVQLLDDTQRSGVEAATHFTPKAFWRKCSSLRGVEWIVVFLWIGFDWPQGIINMWWNIQTGILGDELCCCTI